jgi:hypothetical protein
MPDLTLSEYHHPFPPPRLFLQSLPLIGFVILTLLPVARFPRSDECDHILSTNVGTLVRDDVGVGSLLLPYSHTPD